jgi:hypothetical protein
MNSPSAFLITNGGGGAVSNKLTNMSLSNGFTPTHQHNSNGSNGNSFNSASGPLATKGKSLKNKI